MYEPEIEIKGSKEKSNECKRMNKKIGCDQQDTPKSLSVVHLPTPSQLWHRPADAVDTHHTIRLPTPSEKAELNDANLWIILALGAQLTIGK